MRRAIPLGLILTGLMAGQALAQDAAAPTAMPMPRELALGGAIALIVLANLFSVALGARASLRTHLALALVGVLIGGFALLLLFGGLGQGNAVVGGLLTGALIVLFRLMNQFEIERRER